MTGQMAVMYRDAGGSLTPFSADIDGAGNEGCNIFSPEGGEYFDKKGFEDGFYLVRTAHEAVITEVWTWQHFSKGSV